MKVNVADTVKVQSALDEVQVTRTGKPSTAGVYDADEVRREAEAAEYALEAAGIPASLRKGATVVAHQRKGTKNWSYGTTVVFLERGTSGWFVTTDEVLAAAEAAELRLDVRGVPVAERPGHRFTFEAADAFITVERTTTCWALDAVEEVAP